MKQLFITILTCFLYPIAIGQISIGVSKQNVSVYENFTLSIRTANNCDFSTANIKGFDILGEPSISTQSSTTNINGHVTKSSTITRTYVLKSKKSGTYQLGPFQADCNGQITKSQSIVINVSDTPEKNSEFYSELYCDKKSVYPGEPFVITQKLFLRTKKRTQLEQIVPSNQPTIQKYDITPIDDKGNAINEYETINNQTYNTAIIRKELCFLTEHGDIVIEPYYTSAITGSLFNSKRIEAFTNVINLKSLAKPNEGLQHDIGLTGDFSLSYELSQSTIRAGEALDLKITLKGYGNFQVFNTPNLQIPESFDVFKPETNEDLQLTNKGFEGKKTFHFTYVPTIIGEYKIPAFIIDYFHLPSKKYKQISVPALTIKVEKGENGYGEIIGYTEKDTTNNEFKLIGLHDQNNDISFSENDLYAGTFLHYALLVTPILLLVLILLLKKKRTNNDATPKQRKKVKRKANNHLSNGKKLIKEGKHQQAIEAIDLAFKNYLSHKFNLKQTEITLNTIQAKIEDNNLKSDFISFWNAIELYKYAPITPNATEDLLQKAELLINKLDKQP